MARDPLIPGNPDTTGWDYIAIQTLRKYILALPSGRSITFDSIEEARDVRDHLNGLTLEGKL